jgi:hypothetical protein
MSISGGEWTSHDRVKQEENDDDGKKENSMDTVYIERIDINDPYRVILR